SRRRRPDMREPREAERRHHLQNAEDPQPAADADTHQRNAADDAAREARAERRRLRDHAICVREKPMSRKNDVDSVVAIVSPSLYRKMKPSTNSAPRQPSRRMNSRNGSTIASRRFFGGLPCTSGSRTTSVIAMPGSMNAAVTMNTVAHGM